MTLNTLENSFVRPDDVEYIRKESVRKVKLIRQKNIITVRDVTGKFRTAHSITGGTDITITSTSSLTIDVQYISNDNNTFIRVLTDSDDQI